MMATECPDQHSDLVGHMFVLTLLPAKIGDLIFFESRALNSEFDKADRGSQSVADSHADLTTSSRRHISAS
jgi:hypothetical protein